MWTGYLERSKIHLDGGDGRKIGNPRVYHSQVRPLRIYGSGLREKLLTRRSIDRELYIFGYTPENFPFG